MSTALFEYTSQVSTHRSCDGCHRPIKSVSWRQCNCCALTDYCLQCEPYECSTKKCKGVHVKIHYESNYQKYRSHRQQINQYYDKMVKRIQEDGISNDFELWLILRYMKRHLSASNKKIGSAFIERNPLMPPADLLITAYPAIQPNPQFTSVEKTYSISPSAPAVNSARNRDPDLDKSGIDFVDLPKSSAGATPSVEPFSTQSTAPPPPLVSSAPSSSSLSSSSTTPTTTASDCTLNLATFSQVHSVESAEEYKSSSEPDSASRSQERPGPEASSSVKAKLMSSLAEETDLPASQPRNENQLALPLDAEPPSRPSTSPSPGPLPTFPLDDGAKLVLDYLLKPKTIRILNIDGGGIRGYFSLITIQQVLNSISPVRQDEFVSSFNYICGTSTGGLIAFCLFCGLDLNDIIDIYRHSQDYFVQTWSYYLTRTPMISYKYDPTKIHKMIDCLIAKAEQKRGDTVRTLADLHDWKGTNRLIVTAFNCRTNRIKVFNTGYSKHRKFKIADVLKSTIAAPTFFPVYKFECEGKQYECIDGGVFANDPEMASLWVAKMDHRICAKFRVVSIGTGVYSPKIDGSWGGYWSWIVKGGKLIDAFMEANRSFTETVAAEVAGFRTVTRFRYNVALGEQLFLDDPKVVGFVDGNKSKFETSADFLALCCFINHYVIPRRL